MTMLQRYGAGPDQIDAMLTDDLRGNFMVEGLFQPGEIGFCYTCLLYTSDAADE